MLGKKSAMHTYFKQLTYAEYCPFKPPLFSDLVRAATHSQAVTVQAIPVYPC